jgi:hypothetical protein
LQKVDRRDGRVGLIERSVVTIADFPDIQIHRSTRSTGSAEQHLLQMEVCVSWVPLVLADHF